MKLYLVQHGEALPKEDDPARPLSEKGQADVRRLAAILGHADISVTRVLHSGKKRAQETAELLAAVLAPDQTTEPISGLAPTDPVEPVVEQIRDWENDTVLVGHLPFMAKLVAKLVTGRENDGVAAFQPGSMICLERGETGSWTINWMLRPVLFA